MPTGKLLLILLLIQIRLIISVVREIFIVGQLVGVGLGLYLVPSMFVWTWMVGSLCGPAKIALILHAH